MSEKIYTFPNIEPQSPMTEEEFDKWAEKAAERQNAVVDAIESRDFARLQAEMGGWDDHITPLLLVMGIFGFPAQFKKTTKDEVKKKYAHKVNIKRRKSPSTERRTKIRKHIDSMKNYPKTYDECCALLGSTPNEVVAKLYYDTPAIRDFQRVIISRDAYLSLYNKPFPKLRYVIRYNDGKLIKGTSTYTHLLSFPTITIRDLFYNNFSEDIIKVGKLL